MVLKCCVPVRPSHSLLKEFGVQTTSSRIKTTTDSAGLKYGPKYYYVKVG
jgi:hypothetical protein